MLLGGKTHLLGGHSTTPAQLFSFWTELVHINARSEPGLSKCFTAHMFPLRHSLLITCSVPGMIGKEELLSAMYTLLLQTHFFWPAFIP